MPRPAVGKRGRLSIGGFFLACEVLDVRDSVDRIEGTNFEGYNAATDILWKESDSGATVVTLRASGYFDRESNPKLNPPNITAGAFLANVQVFWNRNVVALYTISSLRVEESNTVIQAQGRVDFSFTAESNGIVTLNS